MNPEASVFNKISHVKIGLGVSIDAMRSTKNGRKSSSSHHKVADSTITAPDRGASPNLHSSTETPHYTFFSNKQIVSSGIKNTKPQMGEFSNLVEDMGETLR